MINAAIITSGIRNKLCNNYFLHILVVFFIVWIMSGCSGGSEDGGPEPDTAGAPAMPAEFSGQAVSNSQINLTWSSNSCNEEGFRIQRDSGSGFVSLATVSEDTVSYNDTALEPSSTYTYRVCAYNNYGDSGYTDSISLTTSAPSTPTEPVALSGQAVSSSQINLTWSDNSSNETGFHIQRDSGSGFTALATVSANSTFYHDTDLTPSTTFSYRVIAYNGVGDSAPSNTVVLLTAVLNSAASINQYGITWTFDKAYQVGQFANGDYWVVGPVTIISITNNYHVHGFTPVQGQDGSMINPGTDTKQGYDHSISSYDASLNVSHPNNQPISVGNPLVLGTNQTLISAVSWLYSSTTNTEPGCPSFNAGTNTPRPVLRTAAVLTCLGVSAPIDSFRPPYVGSDKTVQFNVAQLQTNLLGNLSTTGIASIPSVTSMEDDFARVWLDHVNEYMGSYLHPSENIKVSHGYGQYMSMKIGDATLLLNLDFSNLPGAPSKDTLLIELVQLGIDLAGIADNAGYWPHNGGHNMGRKWPILFAGIMLNDNHMKGVGAWSTIFQEDATTFYVTQDDVTRTHSDQWNPDERGGTPVPYEIADITLPEWGIRHALNPYQDNKLWDTAYRDINGSGFAGFVLSAQIMGQKTAWNHAALFDYEDLWWGITGGDQNAQHVDAFTKSMWNTYRANYPPVWSD